MDLIEVFAGLVLTNARWHRRHFTFPPVNAG